MSMLKLPQHIRLTIEHQPHAMHYMTVEQWLTDPSGAAILGAIAGKIDRVRRDRAQRWLRIDRIVVVIPVRG